MGYLKPFKILGNTPPGTCPECAEKHDPGQPHNKASITYQYKFYDLYGRWPTWKDAMAHCCSDVQDLWREELTKLGVKDWEESDE